MMQTLLRVRDLWRAVRHGSEKSKFATDVLIHGISQAFAVGRGLVLLPLISIGLGLTDYGIWTQISLTASLLLPILTFEFTMSAVRYLPGMREDRDRFAESFFGILAVALALCAVVALAAWPARHALSQLILGDQNYVAFVYLMLALVTGQVCFTYLLNYWRVVRLIAHAALLVGVTLIIAWLKLGVVAGILFWISLQGIFSAVLLVALLRHIPLRLPRDFRTIVPYVRFALPLVLYAATFWVINSSDRYFVVNYFSLAQAGIYTAAYTLSEVATFVKVPLNFVLLPVLSRLWAQGDKVGVRVHTERSIDYYFVLAVPLVVLLSVGAPTILNLFTGADVSEARLVMSLVGIAFLFAGIDQFFRNILMLEERTAHLFVILVPMALQNLACNYLLIPTYGMVGAAASTLVSMALKAAVLYWQSRREFEYRVNLWLLLRVLLASLSFVPVILILPARSIWLLIADAVLGSVLYLGGLFLLRVLRAGEVHTYLGNLLRRQASLSS